MNGEYADEQDNAIDDRCTTSIHASLSKLLMSKKFADMTIRCGGETFNAHQAVVCTQSPFFDRAFSNSFNFKEAASKTIDLPEDDPEILKRFLEFLYTGSYTCLGTLNEGRPSTPATMTSQEVLEALDRPPGVGFDIPNTQKASPQKQKADANPMSSTPGQQGDSSATLFGYILDVDADYYPPPAEREGQEPEEEYNDFDATTSVVGLEDEAKEYKAHDAGTEPRGDYFMHLRVYIMADKYDVPALRLLARDRFYREAELTWEEAENFPTLVDELYRNTPPTDIAMREIVCRLVGSRISDDEVRDKMRSVMTEHGEFAVGVMEYHFVHAMSNWW
ncbi:hypothetical protein AK830_g9706 [Neonectria ditissima]|uniref:BTB domain-containing protein n=1 Tax=Neonectria ditissima TaxID=78410 RepID=A0A0P7AHH4_9HYPO|nr:hypothetical protein AK830_g9706 [Neonectria ditissima]